MFLDGSAVVVGGIGMVLVDSGGVREGSRKFWVGSRKLWEGHSGF